MPRDGIIGSDGLPAGEETITIDDIDLGIDNHFARRFMTEVVLSDEAGQKFIALGKAGVLQGKRATCYPGFEEQLLGADVQRATPVVKDGNVVTSRGAGTALAFAIALVEELRDAATAQKIAAAMLVT